MDLNQGLPFKASDAADFLDSKEPAAQPEPPPDPARPPRPLWKILADMRAGQATIETFLDNPDFDPEKFLGTLRASEATSELDRAELREKIDGSDFYVEQLEAYAERAQRRADAILKRIRSARNEVQRMFNYFDSQMALDGADALFGNERMITRKQSGKSFNPSRQPTDQDMLNLGEQFVRLTPARYDWQKDPIKKAIDEGAKFDFGEIEYSYSLKFQDRDQPPPARKGKVKK